MVVASYNNYDSFSKHFLTSAVRTCAVCMYIHIHSRTYNDIQLLDMLITLGEGDKALKCFTSDKALKCLTKFHNYITESTIEGKRDWHVPYIKDTSSHHITCGLC